MYINIYLCDMMIPVISHAVFRLKLKDFEFENMIITLLLLLLTVQIYMLYESYMNWRMFSVRLTSSALINCSKINVKIYIYSEAAFQQSVW